MEDVDQKNMPAGPSLDNYVEYWIGGRYKRLAEAKTTEEFKTVRAYVSPFYSSDFDAALSAVEAIRKLQGEDFIEFRFWTAGESWTASFRTKDATYEATASSPAHAVCLACLKAAGVKMGTLE